MTKSALCIGISYRDREGRPLAGTLRDVEIFSELLTERFGYDVAVMRDDGDDRVSLTHPNRKNMLAAIDKLAAGAKEGDHIVFFYAGHGDQLSNTPGIEHERDQKDEAIVPSDYQPGKPKTYILDDDIRSRLVNPIVEQAAHIVLVFDCCHSGTAAGSVFDSRAVSWGACPDAGKTLGNHNAAQDGGLFTRALSTALWEAGRDTTHDDVREQVAQRMASRLMAEIPNGRVRADDILSICQPQLEFLEKNLLGSLPVIEAFGPPTRTH
ncbi:hypothetical protein PHLGIDRAFT_37751 [Phlebiopsis gigantea 11061_1 CR5-6]|uniref:Peptidase C14 caspase domain-containing protein n=1 Tax=Phlebiopsis gigantea (strain 11061_1 CR5-6) TaxID=745531 RepID=A0A0C3RRM5_PHLG1|nr:hypothetical protein PHLGIDRAFT_37751 [Phlebiopsis gigantea 11061_1 CR5-6]